jgi:ABC-type uncharacterized transport system permease subunit
MSSTTTYTPTLIEKLLGRNYKWWYITLFHFKSTTAHRFEIISNIFANILSFLTAFFTWYIAFQSGANINFNQIATYFIIGIMITAFTSMILEYEISQEIINGKINNKLLIPTNIFNFFILRLWVMFCFMPRPPFWLLHQLVFCFYLIYKLQLLFWLLF